MKRVVYFLDLCIIDLEGVYFQLGRISLFETIKADKIYSYCLFVIYNSEEH